MFWRDSWGVLRFQLCCYTHIHTWLPLPRSLSLSLSYESIHDLPPSPKINGPFHWSLWHNDPLFESMDIWGRGGKRESFKLQLFCLALLERAELTCVYCKRELDHNRLGWVKEALNISWGSCCWAFAFKGYTVWVCQYVWQWCCPQSAVFMPWQLQNVSFSVLGIHFGDF